MKIYHLLFTLILMQSCASKTESQSSTHNQIEIYNSLIMSYFGPQEMLANSKMKIPFAAIDDHLDLVKFSTTKLPDFVTMQTFQNGTGYFDVKAPKSSSKSKIQLIAEDGDQKSIVNCNINILKPNSPIKNVKLTDCPNGNLDCKHIPNGEIIYLSAGFYKSIFIEGKHDLTFVTDVNSEVQIGQVLIKNSKNIKLQGLWVCPAPHFLKNNPFLIDVDSLSQNIQIVNCTIQTVEDSKSWTQQDWDENAASGISIKGKHCKVMNNFIQNTFHAIQIDNNFNEVSYNIVDRFGGDAIRNTGNDNKFIRNTLKNAVVADYADKDGNHDDLFQSWTFDKPIERIKIIQNNCISILEPDLPLKSKVVQGIACFDGFEKDWVIQNNLVVIDHPHGISLFGAEKCKIQANKVIRNPYHFNDFEANPWIMINRHKDGRKSKLNQLKYNVVDTIVVKDKFSAVTIGNYIIDKKPENYFRNYEGWDFRRK